VVLGEGAFSYARVTTVKKKRSVAIIPLSSEYGIHETNQARLWPWLLGESPYTLPGCPLLARTRPTFPFLIPRLRWERPSKQSVCSEDSAHVGTIGLALQPFAGWIGSNPALHGQAVAGHGGWTGECSASEAVPYVLRRVNSYPWGPFPQRWARPGLGSHQACLHGQAGAELLLYITVQRSRRGLVFKARKLLDHSTLGFRLKKQRGAGPVKVLHVIRVGVLDVRETRADEGCVEGGDR